MQYLAHFGRKRSLKMWPRGVGLGWIDVSLPTGSGQLCGRWCRPPAAIIATTDSSSAETRNFRLRSTGDIG
jgi:hypothetical protein